MAAERTAEQIQKDIELARASLAEAVDQLSYRTNPKRLADNAKQSLKQKAQSPQGQAVIAGVGLVVVVLVVRRLRKRKR